MNNSDALLRYILEGKLSPGETLFVSPDKYNDLQSEVSFMNKVKSIHPDELGYNTLFVHGIYIKRSDTMDRIYAQKHKT